MDNLGEVLIGTIVGFGLGVVFILVIIGKPYKDGQVDALTGKIQYELKTQPDSSKIWVEKGDK